ncbi:MAG: hypothetical protein A2085_00580 [Gemmatimonadetes bacterium GWC2_71_10]|nr:MAG: hypothetical protein A2085_00580 [Gemmatimonadetes bacterium GWC2_71_10]
MQFLTRVLRNWPLKLAALTLSLLVWVLVSAEETRSQLVDVQVAIDVPPNFALVSPLATVRALVSGPGRDLVKLGDQPLTIRVAMPANPGPRWHLVIVPADVRVAPQLAVLVTDVQPRELLVDVGRRATRTLPVALRGAMATRRGWTLDSLAVLPGGVVVSGVQERVAELDSAPTEPVDLGDVDGAFERSVALDTAAYPLLRFEPRRVIVKGRARRT